MDSFFIKEKTLLRQDAEDNYYFIDYLLREKIQKYRMRENIDEFCNRKIQDAEGNSNFIRKYNWLLHYYNEIRTLELTVEEQNQIKSQIEDDPVKEYIEVQKAMVDDDDYDVNC
jgi:hypothetical protein